VSRNTIMLCGTLISREELRHTPAGMPALGFRIGHASEQIEAGLSRNVHLEIDGVALGEVAEKLSRAPLAGQYSFQGFLALRSKQSRMPVLHVNKFEVNK